MRNEKQFSLGDILMNRVLKYTFEVWKSPCNTTYSLIQFAHVIPVWQSESSFVLFSLFAMFELWQSESSFVLSVCSLCFHYDKLKAVLYSFSVCSLYFISYSKLLLSVPVNLRLQNFTFILRQSSLPSIFFIPHECDN